VAESTPRIKATAMGINAVCGRWARGDYEWDRSEADCGNFFEE